MVPEKIERNAGGITSIIMDDTKRRRVYRIGSATITAMLAILLLVDGGGAATITVNASGSADYTRIQDAMNNPIDEVLNLNQGVQSVYPLTFFSLRIGSGIKSHNDSINSGWYSMGKGYTLSMERLNDGSNIVLGNLEYTLQADNISSVSYSEYADWNSSYAKWIFPSNFSLGEGKWLTVDAGKKGYTNEYLPMSISRKLNNSIFKEDGYQLAEFNFTFDDKNFTPAGGAIYASELSSMNASLLLDTFFTDAPLNEVRPFPVRNEHSINFLFNTTKLKEKRTYNISILIRVDLKNNNSVLFKPYYGIWIIYNGTQAPYQIGNTATIPNEILPEDIRYASVSTNASSKWLITRYYIRSAGLNGIAQTQVITDLRIEPNVSISPTNPARASAFVGGENLSSVDFGIIDINNLLSDNMTLLGVDINSSGINGKYFASWYANSFSIKKGNSQEIVTAGIFNRSSWLDYYSVIGFFKKNDTSGEVNAILWFNRTTGILSKISKYDDAFTPLSIENGLSIFKVTKFKFPLGWENSPSPVNGSTYTLYDVDSLNNPYLISVTVPNGVYRAFIHVSDKAGNNYGAFKDIVTGGGAATLINSCTTISSPGEYMLTVNINNSTSNNCIRITSSDVVLDGTGHVIDGIDTPGTQGVFVYNQAGILTNVTVKNLMVTDWHHGVHYRNTVKGHVYSNIAYSNNRSGILLTNSSYSIVENNFASSHKSFRGEVNGPPPGTGIEILGSHNVIKNNNASNNFIGISILSGGPTGDIVSINNTIEGNIVKNNTGIKMGENKPPSSGILVGKSHNNVIRNNIASNNWMGIGILNSSNNNTIFNNTVRFNELGIRLFASHYNTIKSNTVAYNKRSGIKLNETSTYNKILNNLASNNNDSGIVLVEGSNYNTIANNRVNSNFIYGIHIESSSSNTIYNNIFNNTNNFRILNNSKNKWNITNTSGINIIGGSYLGGNFWIYPNGSGFSKTCADGNKDGICDATYSLDRNNIDRRPLTDKVPPRSITNLKNRSYARNYINWTWIDPSDADFSYVKIYIDGNFRANVARGKKFYNATGFLPNTAHRISTRTVDTSGNVNKTWVNHTARTNRDYTSPASITNLINRTYTRAYINWTWKDPSTYDFTKVMVYINGAFRTNITKGKQYYNATGLKNNTYYKISTHTVDTSGNINQTWRNHTARTAT